MATKTRRGMNRRKRMGYRLIILTVMCLLVTGFYAKHRLQQKNGVYQKQEEQLMAQIEEEEQRAKDIEELGKYVQTKKYVEEVAKERLGLVYPDGGCPGPERVRTAFSVSGRFLKSVLCPLLPKTSEITRPHLTK